MSWAPTTTFEIKSPGDAATWLRFVIGTGPLSCVFKRNSQLVSLARENEIGYTQPLRSGVDYPMQVVVLTPDKLTALLEHHYQFIHIAVDKDGKPKKPVPCLYPLTAAKSIINAPEGAHPQVRQLRGIIHTPIVRQDGSVLSTPGYDPVTHLYYAPDEDLTIPEVPDNPSTEQIKGAVSLISEMIEGFDFKTPSDRANYIGLLLTPLLRELAPPPYKLGAVNAHQQGSGKTLLTALLRIIHGGVLKAEMPDSEEFRKAVSTILDVTTGPVVTFDNVSGVLRGSHLSSLLTSDTWSDRRLGSNEEIQRPNDRLWTVTGNNILVGGDNARRVLWVTIDPGMPKPWERDNFKIRNLESWAATHRGELLGALLTMVRAWVAAGQPKHHSRGFDSFGKWIETLDGILLTAGLGLFDQIETVQQHVGEEDGDWEEFLASSYPALKSKDFTLREWAALVREDEPLGVHMPTNGKGPHIPYDSLPDKLAEKARRGSLSGALSYWCRNRASRWAGSYRVVSVGITSDHTKLWRIEKLDTAVERSVTQLHAVQ